MVEANSRLLALNTFCQQLDSVPAAELTSYTLNFLQSHLDAADVRLFRAGGEEPDVPAAHHLQIPVERPRLTLNIWRNQPFSEDEHVFAQLVCSFLSRSAWSSLASSRRERRLALFEQLRQGMPETPDLATLFALLEQALPEAFPGTIARLLLKGNEGRLQLRASSGIQTGGFESVFDRERLEQIMKRKEPLLVNEQVSSATDPDKRTTLLRHILIPIQVRGQATGILWVTAGSSPLTDEDVVYLDLLAGYIGIVLYTNQLIEEAWKRTNQMEMIYGVTESARTLQPLLPTLQEIHTQIARAFDVPSFFVALFDSETQQVTFPYAVDNSQPLEVEPIPAHHPESLAAWVIRTRRPYIAVDWLEGEQPVPGIGYQDSMPRSILCFPLIAGDEVVGAFSVQSDRPHEFDATAQQLLASIADHLAVIIHNARLYSTTQQLVDTIAREYLTAATLRQAIATVGTSLDPDAIVERLLQTVGDVVRYDVVALALVQDGRLELHGLRGKPGFDTAEAGARCERFLQSSSLLRQIQDQSRAVVIEDVRQDPRWQEIEDGSGSVRSWLGVPLVTGGEVGGVLVLEAKEVGLYDERTASLVLALASHASLALQNARLHEEVQLQLAELTTLYEAGAAITANLEQEAVLQTVVEEMVRALNVNSCAVLVREDDRRTLRTAAHTNLLMEESDGNDSGLSGLAALADNPVIEQVLSSRQVEHLRQENTLKEAERALLEVAGIHALLLVPLVRRDQTLGVLALGQTEAVDPLSERDVRLVRNLAGQAAVAVEHAYLYTQARRRIRELSTFHQIVLQINMPLELEVVLDNITESALRLIDANNLHIYLYDDERLKFTFCSALWRDGRRTPAVTMPRPDGLTASVIQSGEVIVIDDASQHELYQSGEAANWGVCAIAGFPLKRADRVIGAFTVTYLKPHSFSPDELLLMNLLADQAAVAVENARLFSDAQRRLQSMSALVDMAKQVTGNLRVELVMQTTVQRLQKLLHARASTIALLSEDKTELIVEAGAGIKPEYQKVRMKLGEGVSGRAVKEQRMIYVRDTRREPDFLFFDSVLRSLLVVPLMARNEVIGTLTVDSDQPEAFSSSDIQLMTVAAAQVSVAIANARLFETVEERAAELAVAYEELKESDRLKDELVQNVSHELRTPLTFIRGYVDLLRDGEMGMLSDEQQNALQIVSEKTGDVTRLVEDIMSLQRIDEKNLIREKFAMSDLLQSAIDCHRLSAHNHGLSLEYKLPVDQGLVVADKGRITQVLDNLIGNAMKFSPDGGTIALQMADRDGEVLVSVSDEGIGVPPDKVGRIFDRFYQIDGSARRRFGGAGIGLAIVKRIIDAHQGHIWVESRVDEGSTFFFTLPKQADPRSPASDLPTLEELF